MLSWEAYSTIKYNERPFAKCESWAGNKVIKTSLRHHEVLITKVAIRRVLGRYKLGTEGQKNLTFSYKLITNHWILKQQDLESP